MPSKKLTIALVAGSAALTNAFSPVGASRLSRNLSPRASVPMAGLLEDMLGGAMKSGFDAPVVMGTEEMMSKKEFGTSAVPIQTDLRWNCDVKTADNICNYNRHYAEYSGYWERVSS